MGTGTRNILLGEHGLPHRKGEIFLTPSAAITVAISALADLHTGRRTSPSCLVARGIPANYIQVEPVFELCSDHTPVIATIGAGTTNKTATPTLTTTHTNWDMFRAYINEHINLRLRIKECAELDEATQYFTTLLQAAAWHSTPPPPPCKNEACGQHPPFT